VCRFNIMHVENLLIANSDHSMFVTSQLVSDRLNSFSRLHFTKQRNCSEYYRTMKISAFGFCERNVWGGGYAASMGVELRSQRVP